MRTVLVTGANRGIGREVARQMALSGYRVILTSRDEDKGKQAVDEMKQHFENGGTGDLIYHQLDVTDEKSIQRLSNFVSSEFSALDALVNNAAVSLDRFDSLLDTPVDIYRITLDTNAFAPLRLCQVFLPGMLERNYGRVVNVSSTAGQIGKMVNDKTSYRLSKIALNCLTLMLANSVVGANVLVNAACPGKVRTAMGSSDAPRSVEEGAQGIVWLATLPAGGPQGGFFRDGQALNW